jgi:Fur family ferric uptake transcriptional regulator
MAAVPREQTKQLFYQQLAGKKVRLTSQRRLIIDTVFSTHQHFTAEQLLHWSRTRDKTVSRATVYRTLPLLTASGLVQEIDFGKDFKYYDPNYADRPNHSHLVCLACGNIVEFESKQIASLARQIAKQTGFVFHSHRLQITARCAQCKPRRARRRR